MSSPPIYHHRDVCVFVLSSQKITHLLTGMTKRWPTAAVGAPLHQTPHFTGGPTMLTFLTAHKLSTKTTTDRCEYVCMFRVVTDEEFAVSERIKREPFVLHDKNKLLFCLIREITFLNFKIDMIFIFNNFASISF